MDGGAWWAAVHGVARSRKRPSNFPFPFPFGEKLCILGLQPHLHSIRDSEQNSTSTPVLPLKPGPAGPLLLAPGATHPLGSRAASAEICLCDWGQVLGCLALGLSFLTRSEFLTGESVNWLQGNLNSLLVCKPLM